MTGDDDDLLEEIILLFLADNPLREADLRAALAKGDVSLFERTAHTIKGSCVLFGADGARDAAQDLEIMGRAGNLASGGPAIDRLAAETRRLSSDLEAFLRSRSHPPAT